MLIKLICQHISGNDDDAYQAMISTCQRLRCQIASWSAFMICKFSFAKVVFVWHLNDMTGLDIWTLTNNYIESSLNCGLPVNNNQQMERNC